MLVNPLVSSEKPLVGGGSFLVLTMTLVASVLGSFGYPVPCLLLALHAPAYGVAAGALAAGAGSAVFTTFSTTVLQQQVPPEMLARVTAFMLTGAFALGSAGFAVIGPMAAVAGAGRLLGVAAAWGILSPAVVLAVPAVRSVRSAARAG